MYFGSVKFFKHLIYIILAVLVLALVVLVIIFATKLVAFKDKSVLNNDSSIHQDDSSLIIESALDKICDDIISNGFSPEEMLVAFENHGINFMDRVYKDHYSNTYTDLDYIKKFPDLYVTSPSEFKVEENMVYLTFDDGPSENTLSILSILAKYNIKATFFVSGDTSERSKEILKKIAEAGHSIGVHSYSHKYTEIYQDMDSFLDDFNKSFSFVYDTLGVKPDIFRFAGGSINAYNRFVYQQIIAEMSRRGFVYYDWNASSEDASANATWTSIYNNAIKSSSGKSRAIILMHDAKDKKVTVTVVEDLIVALQKKGYKFDKLTHDVKPITFGYID